MPDIQTVLPARSEGGSYNVSAPGDFVFVKYTDAPVKLVIDNTEPVTITTGDKRRPSRRFNSFLLENPHDRPIAVVLYVGEGDFDSQIIQGEVSVVPGVRGVDGRWRDDTRRDIIGFAEPLSDAQRTYPIDEPLFETGTLSLMSTLIFDGGNHTIVLRRVGTDTTRYYYVYRNGAVSIFESSTRNITWFQKLLVGTDSFTVNGGPADVCWNGGRLVALMSGKVAAPNAYPRCVVPSHSGATDTRADYAFGSPSDQYGVAVSLCTGPGGALYVLTANGSVWVGGVPRFKLPPGVPASPVKLRYNAATDEFFVLGNSGNMWRLSRSFELLEAMSYGASLNAGNYGGRLDGNMIWGVVGSTTSGKVGGYPMREITTPMALSVSSGNKACRDYQDTIWRADEAPLIDADVIATRIGDRVEAAGEVIKALLIAATGKSVGPEYLDHIYGFEYSAGPAGVHVEVKNTGGRSFAAAGVKDDFVVMLPATIKLVVDDELPIA